MEDLTPIGLQRQINRLYKLNYKQVLYNNGPLSGPVPCCKVLGVDNTTGDLYYKDTDANWQPIAGGGGCCNLQQVTDIGSSTDHNISIIAPDGDQQYGITAFNQSSQADATLASDPTLGGILTLFDNSNHSNKAILKSNPLTDLDRNLLLPDGDGTLVLTVNGQSANTQGNVDVSAGIAATIPRSSFLTNVSYPGFATDDDTGTIFKQGAYYLITGIAGVTGIDIILQCTDILEGGTWAQFSEIGDCLFLNADFQNIGVYDGVNAAIGQPFGNQRGIWQASNENVTITDNGDVVIYNNLQYGVIDNNSFNGTSPDTNTTAYQVLPKSATNVGYVEESDKIVYDFNANTILWRMDKRNNKINGNSFSAWDWGNNNSHDYRQEQYSCTVNGLNNNGEISGQQNSLTSSVNVSNNGGTFNITVNGKYQSVYAVNNTGEIELNINGFSNGVTCGENSGQIIMYLYNTSVVYADNNSGTITSRHYDQSQANFNNNGGTISHAEVAKGIDLQIALNSGITHSQCKYAADGAYSFPSGISYSDKELTNSSSTFDITNNLGGGNSVNLDNYVGVVYLENYSIPIITIEGSQLFEITLSVPNIEVPIVTFATGDNLIFPLPSTGTTIRGNNLDFIKFLYSTTGLFKQTSSEQY